MSDASEDDDPAFLGSVHLDIEALTPPSDDPADPVRMAARLDRAARLARHLDDRCVCVDRLALPEGRVPLRLCTFAVGRGVPLFALVDHLGGVCVGRADRLSSPTPVSLALAGFDRRLHEVLSLFATPPQRGRTTADLWVVLRCWPETADAEPEARVYHAVVVWDAAHRAVVAHPAADDGPTQREGREWRGQDFGDLPEVVRRANFCVAFGSQPFVAEVDALADGVPAEDRARFLAWQPGWCAWTDSRDSLVLRGLAGAARGAYSGEERVRGLAFAPPATPDVARLFVVTDEDLRELRLGVADGAVAATALWRQPLRLAVRGVATVPTESAEELLVATRDGRVLRLRVEAAGSIEAVWTRLWQAFERDVGARSVEEWLKWAEHALRSVEPPWHSEGQDARSVSTENRRQVLLARLVERVLEPGSNEGARSRCAKLLCKEGGALGRGLGLQRLLRDVERALVSEPLSAALVATELLSRAYDDYPPFTFQEPIDLLVRRLLEEMPEKVAANPWLSQIAPHCRDSRRDLIRQSTERPPTAGHDANRQIREYATRIELWANAFVLEDALPLSALTKARGFTLGSWLDQALVLNVADERVVVLANTRGLITLCLLPNAKLDEGSLAFKPLGGLRHISALRDARGSTRGTAHDRLLTASADGRLAGFRWDSIARSLMPWGDLSAWSGTGGSRPVGALATLPLPATQPPGWHIAAATVQGRRSRVELRRLGADGALASDALWIRDDLGVVRCIALARDDQAGLTSLVYGQGGLASACLLEFDAQLTTRGPYMRRVDGRIARLRVDDPRQPHFIALAEGGGLVWGVDLKRRDAATASSRVRWIHRLARDIVFLGSVRLRSDVSVFLVAADDGRLLLLGSATGDRVWKHALHLHLRSATAARLTSNDVALLTHTADGTLRTFVQPALEQGEARSSLPPLPPPNLEQREGPGHNEDRQSAWVFQQWVASPANVASLFPKLSSRTARARLLRACLVAGHGSTVPALARALTLREVALALNWLRMLVPADDARHAAWRRALAARVAEPRTDPPLRGDNGRQAWMAAWVAWFEAVVEGGVTSTALAGQQPHPLLLSERWVRLEFARALVQAVAREHPRAPDLPARLLGVLSRVPPSITSEAATVLSNRDVSQGFLLGVAAIVRLVEGRRTLLDTERLQDVCDALAAGDAGQRPLARMVVALISLAMLPRAGDAATWAATRSAHLIAWRDLHALATGSASEEGLHPWLQKALRTYLPADPLPHDGAPLAERRQWMESARTRAETSYAPELSEELNAWRHFMNALADRVRSRLSHMAHLELAALERLVRVRLDHLRAEWERADVVKLTFDLVPEGATTFRDIEVDIAALGPNGLLPAPGLVQRLNRRYAVFPGQAKPETAMLTGHVMPDQAAVRVLVQFRSAGGYDYEEAWTAPLPQRSVAAAGETPFPHWLRAATEFLGERLLGDTRKVLVTLACDAELGCDGLVDALSRRYEAKVLDMDAAFQRWGKSYQWHPEALTAWVSEAAPVSQPVILMRCERTLRTLSADERSTALETALRHWQASERRVILVVSSDVMALLQPFLVSSERLDAHRVLLAPGAPEALRHEALRWVRENGGLDNDSARVALATLGYDLRLVTAWLSCRPRTSATTFVHRPEAHARILATLRELRGLDLAYAMAGVIYECALALDTVEVGHVPVVDWHAKASRGRTARVIQARGVPFTRGALNSVRTIAPHGSSVRVQGIGERAASSSRYPTQLAWALGWGKTTVDATVRRLAEAGVATRIGPVLRTLPPYRTVIEEVYDAQQRAQAPAQTLDACAYRVLATAADGVDHEAPAMIECFAMADLARLDATQLAWIVPALVEQDARALAVLFKAWVAPKDDRLPNVMGALFGEAATADGDSRDTALDRLRGQEGVYVFARQRSLRGGVADEYWVWLAREAQLALRDVQDAMDEAQRTGSARRVIVLGPGTANWPRDPERKVVVLRERELLAIAARPELRLLDRVRHVVKSLSRLTALSPYRTAGALPAGSRLFVGREAETDFVRQHIDKYSMLIVGSRRIGKTSLLNQLCDWIERERRDLLVVRIDCQGITTAKAFELELQHWCQRYRSLEAHGDAASDAIELLAGWHPGEDLARHVAERAEQQRRRLVLALNEVDALLADQTWSLRLRALNDDGRARLLMVGYVSALTRTQVADDALYHLFQGPDRDRSVIALGPLKPEAAAHLVDLLDEPPLELRWQDGARELGRQRLIERSYGIPWLLQSFCHRLVEQLEREQRADIRLADVEGVAGEDSSLLWEHIEKTNYAEIVFAKGTSGDAVVSPWGARERARTNCGVRLALMAVARHVYVLGKKATEPGDDPPGAPSNDAAPIHDPQLAHREALTLGFTVGQARDICVATFKQMLVNDDEKHAVRAWFDTLDLERVFQALTLTIVLEPDARESGRYAFLLHIFPRELWRRYGRHSPRLDDPFIRTARELWALLRD